MSPGRTLTAAVVGLAVVFTAAFGAGRLVPPLESGPTAPATSTAPPTPGHDTTDPTTHSG